MQIRECSGMPQSTTALLGALAVAPGASSKEGARARLLTPLPFAAKPGSAIQVRWAVERSRAERAAGKTLAHIARDLNASGTPTAHGGRQWWPSTVRAIFARV